MVSAVSIILVVIATLLGATGSFFMKKGAAKFNFNPLKQLRNKEFLIGTALYGLSSLAYIFALRNDKLSVLYPLTSISYVWVAIFSTYLLKEKISLVRWLGIGLVIIGIFTLVLA